MPPVDPLSLLSEIKGVSAYLVLDSQGQILPSDSPADKKLAVLVHACGRDLGVLGGGRFHYLVFTWENKADLLIFPVGNQLFGGVLESQTCAETVMAAVNAVFEGQPPQKAAG